MGKTETAVRSWESGKSIPPVKVLEKLADHFGITLGDLCDVDLTTGVRVTAENKPMPGVDRLRREKELLHKELDLQLEEIKLLHESIKQDPRALAELKALDPELYKQLEKWAAGED